MHLQCFQRSGRCIITPDTTRANNNSYLLTALWQAQDKLGIGHRDVTLENIIIYRRPGEDRRKPREGYLIDWDMAWELNKPLAEGGTPFSVRSFSSLCGMKDSQLAGNMAIRIDALSFWRGAPSSHNTV